MADKPIWKQDTTLRPLDDEDIGRDDWTVWLRAATRDHILITMSSNGSINTRPKARAMIAKIIAGLNAEEKK